MTAQNWLPRLSLGILGICFAYILIFASHVTIAPNDYGDRIDWDLVMLGAIPSAAIVANLLVGIWRAAKAKDYVWLVAILMFFPLSYWYTLLVNTGKGANNSFKPKPLRGSA